MYPSMLRKPKKVSGTTNTRTSNFENKSDYIR